jgi:hypothetical protein
MEQESLEEIIKDINRDLEFIYTLSGAMNSAIVRGEVHNVQKRLRFIDKKFNKPIVNTITNTIA